MEELKKRMLKNLNTYISELEDFNNECNAVLADATQQAKYTENDIAMLAVFAKDNYERLQYALRERDLLNKY